LFSVGIENVRVGAQLQGFNEIAALSWACETVAFGLFDRMKAMRLRHLLSEWSGYLL
jgi:hypothetical protein